MFLIKQSIKALSANKGRTALTMLGIVIGIAVVVLVLSAGAGFRSLIDNQLETLGSNTMFIQTRVPPTTKNRASSNQGATDVAFSGVAITSFKQRDLDSIKQLSNVSGAYGIVTGQVVATYRSNKKATIYYGSSAERFLIDKTPLEKGRFYTQSEDNSASQVVILGSEVAKDLFDQDDPIGKIVRLGTLNFQVIGVYEPQGALNETDQIMFIPLNTAQKKLLGIDYISIGIVAMRDINLSDATAEEIRQVMRRNHNITDPDKDDFVVQTQAEALETFNTIFSGITYLLISIATISLIVGGVGIMNIMYVVVTERTAEIGLKKALGARESDILYEFLTEAIMVTIFGGIVGIAFGAFLGFIVSIIAQSANLAWTFSVPVYAIVIAFSVSATIGIFFGVFPARSASKLDPVEAMRYE